MVPRLTEAPTYAEQMRFRVGWVLLGLVGPMLFAFAFVRIVPNEGSATGHIVLFPMLSAFSSYLQCRWAQYWRLDLPPVEYALLWLLGSLVQAGLGVLMVYVHPYGTQFLLYFMGSLFVIAAPTRPLRRAGVKIGPWWLWNVLGLAIDYVLILFLYGFLLGVGAPAWLVSSIPSVVGQGLILWLASKAIWPAIVRSHEEERNLGVGTNV